MSQGVPPRQPWQPDEQGGRGRRERPSRPHPDAFGDGTDEDPPPWAGMGIYPTGPGGRERRPRPAEAGDRPSGSARSAPVRARSARAAAVRATSAPKNWSGPQDGDDGWDPTDGGKGGGGGRSRGRRAQMAKARKARREIIIAAAVVVVGILVVLGVLGKLPFQGKPASASHGSQFVTTFQPGEFHSVPNACGAVSSATISQFLPGKVARVSQALGSSVQSQCTWTLDAKPDFRVLTVTSQAYSPSLLASGDGSATFSAIDAYGNELQNLEHPGKKTKTPVAQIGTVVGLGSTAFSALQVFHQGGGNITDEVTIVVRDHNALIIVTMQGQQHGGGFGPVPVATLRAGALAAAHEAIARLR
ncbi:MAG TPA: hypothetical protein VMC83_20305 [Streptosporangiaceae bacterium]|nr:hypothetical protein [Streptosporangiaceae bacterium]